MKINFRKKKKEKRARQVAVEKEKKGNLWVKTEWLQGFLKIYLFYLHLCLAVLGLRAGFL